MKKRCTSRASFQFKIFSIFTVLSFFISCAFITLHVLDKAHETSRHARKELLLLASELADSVRLPLFAEDRGQLAELAERTGRTPEIRRVVISTVDGRVLADVASAQATPGEKTISQSAEVLSLSAGVPGLAEGENSGAARVGTVRIERGTGDLRDSLYLDVALSCLIALFFWLIISAFSFLLVRRLTRSFDALVRGVQAMKEGDYASRIQVLSADECGKVALAINALSETLEQRDRENQDLTAELRASIETEVRAREELAVVNRTLARENIERVQAEQAARKSEQTLRKLMDLMPVGVLLACEDGSVDYVNQFLVESFGYRREEIATLNAWFSLAFPDPDYLQEKREEQRKAQAQSRSGEAKPYDARVTCKGGEVRHVLLSNQVQGDRTIVVVIDITDRESMQEQLNKIQKLESLGILAGGIAHNFNNALTGVMGFISLARCSLGKDDGALNFLQLAEKASLRAAEMARQLLTFASGGAPVKKSLSLYKLVEEVVSLTLNGSNVRCEVQMPPFLPLIKADEGQLVQALSNIVINAMQAMPDGGVITLAARTKEAPCTDPGHTGGMGFVSLSIRDEGHGISEADLPKIFDPYFSTKETTGLGLASVHSIIYRHGGHISVASQLGKGTTFTICLPSTRELSSPDGEPAKEATALRSTGGCVLVMDDDPTVRGLSGKMLAFLGYETVVCADGKEAVALYRARREAGDPFLAVILDLTVPGGMGGVEAAREILGTDPEANLIVSSGYSYDPVLAQYRKYGFCGAVAKPYKAEELGYELSLLH